MTPQDKERLERCKRVLQGMLVKEKYEHKKQSLRDRIGILQNKLSQPVEPIVNTGEHFKTDNPFI